MTPASTQITRTSAGSPRVSVVVTVYNEGEMVTDCLERIVEAVTLPCEVLVVYDTADDSSRAPAEAFAARDDRIRPTLNTYGRGPAYAIRYGIDRAVAPVIVVTMADGCDDPSQIDTLTKLVERGEMHADRSNRSSISVGKVFPRGAPVGITNVESGRRDNRYRSDDARRRR